MSINLSKTPGIIIAEIAMTKAAHHGAFFMVEGEEDSKFWSPRIDETQWQLVIAGGKPNLLGAASLLDQSADERVIGIVDSDFDRVIGNIEMSPRVTATDQHDLDVFLVCCGALRIVVHEIGDANALKALETKYNKGLAELAAEVALHFGKLRLLNDRRKYQVNFGKHLKPYAYVSEHDWAVNVNQLHTDFCAHAGIMEQVLASVLPQSDARRLYDCVQGHDLLRIIDIGLKGFLRGAKSCGEKELRSKLRIAVQDSHLAASKMCGTLEQIAAAFRLPRLMAT
jgi:hypothetical protein